MGAFIQAEISSPAYISNTVICKLSSQPLTSYVKSYVPGDKFEGSNIGLVPLVILFPQN